MRLRNLRSAVSSSTARIRVSPRALSPLMRFDPMNPAAPVTTVYMICLSEFDVDFADLGGHERHPRGHRAQQLIADGARRGGDVVDRQAFSPEHHRAADGGLGNLGEID